MLLNQTIELALNVWYRCLSMTIFIWSILENTTLSKIQNWSKLKKNAMTDNIITNIRESFLVKSLLKFIKFYFVSYEALKSDQTKYIKPICMALFSLNKTADVNQFQVTWLENVKPDHKSTKCYGRKGHIGLNEHKVTQMFRTHSFTYMNTGKVSVKEVKYLLGVSLVIIEINPATKFIAYKIKASERIVIFKMF